MAPRAIGLGATQITFIVVTALATTVGVGALADFNFAFALLQIPLGIIGVPLGIVVLPSLSRERSGRRGGIVRDAADAGAAAARLRHGPDHRADRDRPPASRRDPVRERQDLPAQPRPDRLDACVFRHRADRARPDRRPRPRVLRPPGHGHAGPRRGRGGRHQLQPGGRPRRAVRAAGHRRLRSRSPPGSRPSPCSPSCTIACRTSSCAGWHGSGSRRSSAARWPGPWRSWPSEWLTNALGIHPGRLVLVGVVILVSLVFSLVYARSRSCCGSPNCRLSSGSWPTCSAAPPGRDGRRPHVVGRVRRGE